MTVPLSCLLGAECLVLTVIRSTHYYAAQSLIWCVLPPLLADRDFQKAGCLVLTHAGTKPQHFRAAVALGPKIGIGVSQSFFLLKIQILNAYLASETSKLGSNLWRCFHMANSAKNEYWACLSQCRCSCFWRLGGSGASTGLEV